MELIVPAHLNRIDKVGSRGVGGAGIISCAESSAAACCLEVGCDWTSKFVLPRAASSYVVPRGEVAGGLYELCQSSIAGHGPTVACTQKHAAC
jgi:hypothetical protein